MSFNSNKKVKFLSPSVALSFCNILDGSLDELPRSPSHLIKLFVTSSSDHIVERCYFRQNIFPMLQEYCQVKFGDDFQVVDLYLGMKEEFIDDEIVSSLSLEEISNSERLSDGPVFLGFIGQKYGSSLFPSRITSSDFELIRQTLLDHGESVKLLDEWFQKDENSVPSNYILIPINSKLQNFDNYEAPDLQYQDRQLWKQISKQLQSLLKFSSPHLQGKIPESTIEHYQSSLIHQEFLQGILNFEKLNTYVYFLRIFDHLIDWEKDEARNYLDFLEKEKDVINEEAQHMLANLRCKLIETIPPNRLFQCHLDWTKDLLNHENESKTEYIENVSDKTYEIMIGLIEIGKKGLINDLSYDPVVEEVLRHLTKTQSLSENVKGRDDTLLDIESYIQDCFANGLIHQTPFIIFGESGSGKTTIMAKASLNSSLQSPKNRRTIVRYCGTTSSSSTVRRLILSLCYQLNKISENDLPIITDNDNLLIVQFHKLLSLATKDEPLVIFLDSLDKLDDKSFLLNWIPRRLPPFVAFIISIGTSLDDGKTTNLESLKTSFPNTTQFKEVTPLDLSTNVEIFTSFLASFNRTLTSLQRQKIFEYFSNSPLPLFIKLLNHNSLTWTSFTSIEEMRIGSNISELFNTFIEKLELKHGFILVSHFLSFITISKNGFSELELEDLLSLDDEVWNEVYHQCLPSVQRIPSYLWMKIKSDLNHFLIENERDQKVVLSWAHNQYPQVIRKRYLHSDSNSKGSELERKLHLICSEYYLGTWVNRKKPLPNFNEEGMDRLISNQPLFFELDDEKAFNYRKLSLLPYHLILGGNLTALKEHTLFNLEFILTKIRALSLPELLSDFKLAKEIFIDDWEIKFLRSTLILSASAIHFDARNIAPEIVGRLANYVHKSDSPLLGKLIIDAKNFGENSLPLMPLYPCLSPPHEVSQRTLEGHSGPVIAVTISPNGVYLVSSSEDKTIKIWNLNSGTLIHDLQNQPEPVRGLCISNDSKYLICYYYLGEFSENHDILVWNLETGELIRTLVGHVEGKCRTIITNDSQFAISATQKLIKIWSLDTGEIVSILEGSQEEILDIDISNDGKILVSCSQDDVVIVWDFEKKTILKIFKEQFAGYSINKVRLTMDKTRLIIGGLTLAMINIQSEKEIFHRTSNPLSSCIFIKLTLDEKYLVTGDYSGIVSVFNVETGTLLYQITQSLEQDITALELIQDEFIFISTKGENRPRICELKTGQLILHPKGHQDGITSSFKIKTFTNEDIIATSSNDHTLKIWNFFNLEKSHETVFGDHRIIFPINEDQGEDEDEDEPLEDQDLSFETTSPSLSKSGSKLRLHHSPSEQTLNESFDNINEDNIDNLSDFLPYQHHKKGITSFSLFQNGKFLLSCDSTSIMKMWDLETGNFVRNLLNMKKSEIDGVEIAPDNQTAISYFHRHMVWYLWNLETFETKQISTMNKGTEAFAISSAFFSENQKYLITITTRGFVCVWKDYIQLYTTKFRASTVLPLPQNLCVIYYYGTPTDKFEESKLIKIMNLETGEVKNLEGHEDKVQHVVATKNGDLLISGSSDKKVIIWDLASKTIKFKLENHKEKINFICLDHQEKYLASASTDKTIIIWDLKKGKKLHIFENLSFAANRLMFTKDCHYLLSYSENETRIIVWDLQTGKLSTAIYLPGKLRVMLNNTEKNQIIIGTNDGHILVLKANGSSSEPLTHLFSRKSQFILERECLDQLLTLNSSVMVHGTLPTSDGDIVSSHLEVEVEEEEIDSPLENRFQGWMLKLGGLRKKTFQRRHFTFSQKDKVLQWTAEEDGPPRNFISLDSVQSISLNPPSQFKKDFCFSLDTKSKVYVLAAPDKISFERWTQLIQESLGQNQQKE